MYLLRLVWSGKLPEVRVVQLGQVKVRLWSDEDLHRAEDKVKELGDKRKKEKTR